MAGHWITSVVPPYEKKLCRSVEELVAFVVSTEGAVYKEKTGNALPMDELRRGCQEFWDRISGVQIGREETDEAKVPEVR